MRQIVWILVVIAAMATGCSNPEPERRDPTEVPGPGSGGEVAAGDKSLLDARAREEFVTDATPRVYRLDNVMCMTTDSIGIMSIVEGRNRVRFVDIDTGLGVALSYKEVGADSALVMPEMEVNGIACRVKEARMEHKTESGVWIAAVDSIGAVYCIVYQEIAY
ncbi:MAG: hypothetical protein J1E84_08175 [Muribaculaceae bacterium]|nr:hypothetical protein [Muribaculaceae bacterium]